MTYLRTFGVFTTRRKVNCDFWERKSYDSNIENGAHEDSKDFEKLVEKMKDQLSIPLNYHTRRLSPWTSTTCSG